jgi:hypothetical protein
MSKIHSIGLAKITVGAVGNNTDSMPTAMEQLGRTFKGSAQLTSDDDTVTDFFVEEEEDPIDSVVSQKGSTKLTFSVAEWDADSLVKIFGGTKKTGTKTIDGKTYNAVESYIAPSEQVQKEMAIRVISLLDVVVDIPRAKVTAKFTWNLARTELAKIDITAKILSPASGGPFTTYKLPPATNA